HSRNALAKYSKVIDAIGKERVSAIEMNGYDTFIVDHFGKLPLYMVERSKVEYTYYPLVNNLTVRIVNVNKYHEFEVGRASTADIKNVITCSLKLYFI
ncbi:unnamed protein product, partial [Didymodactylos carnosus]